MLAKINSQQNKPQFQSLKPTIRLGENAIREFKREYPYIASPSKTSIRLYQLNYRKSSKKNIITKLISLIEFKKVQLNYLRTLYDWNSAETLAHSISKTIKQTKIANCGEMARIMKHRLAKKGVSCQHVNFFINKISDRPCKDHSFLLLNKSPHGNIYQPSTWGSKAVIIDPWMGECKPAKEMLLRYEEFFKINKKDDNMAFAEVKNSWA